MTPLFITSDLLPHVLAGVGVAYGFWRLLLRPYLENKKPFANLPMASGSHWLLGHMLMFYGDIEETQAKLVNAGAGGPDYNELGRTGHWVGRRPCLAITRWQDAKAVLNSESWRDANPLAKKMFSVVMPNTILMMNGREWKHNRAAINKAFTPTGLSAATDMMIEVTETVATSIKERIAQQGGVYQTEIEPIMKLITMDVFGKSTFSRDFRCTENLAPNEFAAAFDALDITRDNKADINIIHSYVEGIISERMEERKEGSVAEKKNNDLLTHIIDANSGDRKAGAASDEVLRDVVATVLFAGYDTTSVTLTYALYMLCQNPDIVTKCLEEISTVGSLKNYNDLVYCRAVITETLRLFPPAAQTIRTLQKPVQLPGDGFVIPAGTSVMVPIWSIHRDERNFPQPLNFLPERWVRQELKKDGLTTRWVERDPSKEDAASTVPAGNLKAFFAFSGGGRNCPGMKFAWQEATIVLAGLLKEFKFEAMPGYKLHVKREGPVQHPQDQMPMKITVREANQAQMNSLER